MQTGLSPLAGLTVKITAGATVVSKTTNAAGEARTSYTPTSGWPRDDYRWKVRAVDKAGNKGDWSDLRTLEVK